MSRNASVATSSTTKSKITLWTQSLSGLQEHEMTCLLNYSPEEQPQLQWLASEAAAQHTWAQDSHTSIFSSQTGLLRSLQLANTLQDTLWAMSLVRSRTFSEAVRLPLSASFPQQMVQWLALPCHHTLTTRRHLSISCIYSYLQLSSPMLVCMLQTIAFLPPTFCLIHTKLTLEVRLAVLTR